MHYQEKVDLLFKQERYLHRDLNTLLNYESDEFQILAQSVRLLIMHVKDELIRASLLKIYVDLNKKNE